MTNSDLVKLPAYALLRDMHTTYPMTEKSVILGRLTENEWCVNRGKTSEKTLYYNVSSSKKVSKEAIKIEYNDKKEEFFLTNLNKNTILVDRAPQRLGDQDPSPYPYPDLLRSDAILSASSRNNRKEKEVAQG